MLGTHLRRNAVAYLALAVACTTGTAYAADHLAPGSVTSKALAKNAVTSPKVKAGTITGGDLKNGTVGAVDMAEGAITAPADVVVRNVGNVGVPSDKPDRAVVHSAATTSGFRGGRVLIRYFSADLGTGCSASGGNAGLYVDAKPVIGTRRGLPAPASSGPMEILAIVDLTPGVHTVASGVDCPLGNVTDVIAGASTITIQRIGD